MRPQWSKKTPVLRSDAAAQRAANLQHPPEPPGRANRRRWPHTLSFK